MIRIAIFDPATGAIRSVMTFSHRNVEDALLNIPDGALAAEVGEDVMPATHYIGPEDAPVKYPPKPAEWSVWDGAQWIDPRTPADLAEALDEKRVASSVTKIAFITGCMEIGILTPPEAIAASRGEIPDSFAPIVAAMSPMERDYACIHWGAARQIDRLDPFILAVAATAGVSDATLDALFGLTDAT